MAKILELQRKDKHNKERTVGSIEIKNQTETTAGRTYCLLCLRRGGNRRLRRDMPLS